MKKMMMFVSVLGFALGMTACGGPTCEDLCDKSQDEDCEGVTDDTVKACKDGCADYEKCVDATGWNSEYDDTLSCMDDKFSCTADDICTTESTKLAACVLENISGNESECTF